ncbi:MAG: type II toxin-antitoxin system VapC family toxin [Tunicatimonas sp.]
MNVFLDTSTLFKLYHHEEGSAELDAFLDEYEIDHFYISEIALVEFCSAATRRFRMGEMSLEQMNNTITLFDKDYASYKIVKVDSDLLSEAKELTVSRKSKGLKTLDAIQLASAIAVKDVISVVKTSDERLGKIMVLEGLKTTLSH